MKTFDLHNYTSILKYSLAENRKIYLTAFGIGLFTFLFIATFVFYSAYGFNFSEIDLSGVNVQTNIEVSSFCTTLFFAIIMVFVATQAELVNRYCIAREGTQFTLLPATYIEKGFGILTMYVLVVVVGSLLFHLVVYSLMSLMYSLYGADFTFSPFVYKEIIPTMGNIHTSSSGIDDATNTFLSHIIYMVPVTCAIKMLLYFTLVTYFKKKAQLKALLSYLIINNVLSWVFVIVASWFSLNGIGEL